MGISERWWPFRFKNPFHFIAESNSESALEKLDFAKRKKLSVESETYKFI